MSLITSDVPANFAESLVTSFNATNPRVQRDFWRLFPKTRESYDIEKQQEVLKEVSGSSDWKRLGKPWFRQDAETGLVYRKSLPTRSRPTGRITVCVPYKHEFDIAAIEHVRSHILDSDSNRPSDIDSTIASKYTGIDRDQLRFMRQKCADCNAADAGVTKIELDCRPVVRRLLVTGDALNLESHPPTKARVKGVSRTPHYKPLPNNIISDAVSSSAHKYYSVYWIGCDDKLDEPISTQTLHHRHTAAANSRLIPNCFLPDEAQHLMHRAGPAFLFMDREHVHAHQSLVTASVLAASFPCKVHFQNDIWMRKQLSRVPALIEPASILMLAWRQYDEKTAINVQSIYERTKQYEPSLLRVFPSAAELEHVLGKVDDIRALDEIAKSTHPGWSFRPITCDSATTCRLSEVGVLKRSHSCGSEHVILKPKAIDIARHLRCQSSARRISSRRAAQTTERWFHQEFVDGLRKIGEFRVFIVTVQDTTARRGRRGRIIQVVHTIELLDRELVVTVLGSGGGWSDELNTSEKIDLDELGAFALYVFEALRSRPDWSTGFESLEIGARVDVGVTVLDGGPKYFVNEVTRIYEADFFAEWLAQPGTQTCREVSKAFAEVFVDTKGN
ncbi:hypothetical protein KC353_g225 [Hortaea werneckii]|nr:hypothetical protein KC353_g225 [Hortaea werneckii]